MHYPVRRKSRRFAPNRSSLQRRAASLESLETRCLLAGDLQLVNDESIARQNQNSMTLDVLSNDFFSDDYEGPKEITSVSFGSEGGAIQISDDRRSLEYAPPGDFSGTERFTYFIDGQAFAEVSVNVESPLREDEFSIPPDGRVHQLNVLGNDPFWEDYTGERRITLASVSSGGSDVTIGPDGQSVLYRASEEGTRSDQFIYIVDEIYPVRVTIDIPQTTQWDRFETLQNSRANTLDVVDNDPFWPGYGGERKITSIIGANPDAVVETTDNGTLIAYTPAPNFSGWDQFTYVIDDRFENSVSVVVHRPVRTDWFEIDENSTDFDLNVLANDYYRDLSGTHRDVVERVTSVSPSENGGQVEISDSERLVIYTPPAGFTGNDTFTYVAEGKYEATVNVAVTRPVRNDSLQAFQDTPNYLLRVTENDFVGNGYEGPRRVTQIGESENGATLVLQGNSIAYTPPAGFSGGDRFTYVVDDDLEASVNVSVVTLAQSDSDSFCADPNHGAYRLDVLRNDHFSRGYEGPGLITSAESLDEDVSVEISADGRQLLVEPSSAGSNRVSYTVDGKYTADAWIRIDGHLVWDSMVTDQNSGPMSINPLENDFRRNGRFDPCKSSSYRGQREITAVSMSENGGQVTIGDDGESVAYTPPADFVGRDAFTYEVDGIMQSTVTVNVIRRVRDDQFRVSPGNTEAMPVLVNDLFGGDYFGAQRITDVTPSQLGAQVSVSPDGSSLVYEAPADANGTDRLTYTVDGALKAEVQIEVRPAGASLFPRFETLGDFEQFLLDDALTRYEHLFGQSAWPVYDFLEDSAFELGPAAPDAANRNHSETNVQVDGVDEGDIVEFDSDYVYMLTGNDLVILDAWPAEDLAEISRYTIEGRPLGEFLKGDRLTVVSEVVSYFPFWEFPDRIATDVDVFTDRLFGPVYDVSATTIVTVFDVSDRAEPSVVQTTKLDGHYVESRGVGDYVYVALSNNAVAPGPEIKEQDEGADDEFKGPGVYETRDEYIERFRAQVGEMVESALPNYFSFDAAGELVRSGLVHQPEDIYQRIDRDASSLVSLVSVNVTNDEPGLAGSSGVYTNGAAKVYASLDHFYVFEDSYNVEDGTATRILKFDWDGENGSADFVSQGYVAGQMLNQFSADEYDGHLRIATTIRNAGSGNWTGRAENDLFVLRDDGGVLEFTGSLQNLALNETIRSVRFMGPRAFVVTFRDVDPLFGLDVSDHSSPSSLGHLTLPGFSSYMQLIDQDHLLAVGRNTPTGGAGPAQVSLFDVSDLQNPRQIDEYTFERFSTTEAAVDHHAFGYFATHGLLAVPATQQYVERIDTDGDGYRETRQWNIEYELMVFRIDVNAERGTDQGIVLVSQIEHDSLVRRSGYIGDKLYSIAEDSVKVVDVADPKTILAEATELYHVPELPDPIPLRLDAEALAAMSLARDDLAQRLSIESGKALPVTAEPLGVGWQLVFRVGDQQYLYETRGANVELIDGAFKFEDAGRPVQWQNPHEPADVNGDGDIAPNDAILIINAVAKGGHSLPGQTVVRQIGDSNHDSSVYWDVSGDGQLTTLDALLVINRLNDLAVTNIRTDDIDLTSETFEPLAIDRVFGDTLGHVGDANLDGRFDSSDLVRVFQAGEYEDQIARNSTWAEGDWNGDREFGTADLVLAFQYGDYASAARISDIAFALLADDDD